MQFGVALYNCIAGLNNLVPTAGVLSIVRVMLGKAKAITAYDDSVLQNDVISLFRRIL